MLEPQLRVPRGACGRFQPAWVAEDDEFELLAEACRLAGAEDHVHPSTEICTDAKLPAPEVLVGRDEDPILLCTPVGDLRVARLVP